MKNTALRQALRKVLTAVHYQQKGQVDRLFSSMADCEKERAKDKQGRCVDRLLYNYKAARKILYGYAELRTANSKDFLDAHEASSAMQGQSFKGRPVWFLTENYCGQTFNSVEHGDPQEGRGVGRFSIISVDYANCEHTWPKSRFNCEYEKTDPRQVALQYTDLHHLTTTQTRANSIRSSFEFGETSEPRTGAGLCSPSQIGQVAIPPQKRTKGLDYEQIKKARRATVFAPPVSHRGNVARALFYFSVRYQLPLHDIEEYYLKKWHKEDPVDNDEKLRHARIYRTQRDRNPFIDYPELVDRIHNF